jgi:hypothetical protein
VYVFYNLGYTKARHPVYSILKWVDYWSAIIALGAIAAIILIYFAMSGIAAGRDRIWASRAVGDHSTPMTRGSEGPVQAPAPLRPGFYNGPGVGAPVYSSQFYDATVVAPCSTCCQCCVLPLPLLSSSVPPSEGYGTSGPVVLRAGPVERGRDPQPTGSGMPKEQAGAVYV